MNLRDDAYKKHYEREEIFFGGEKYEVCSCYSFMVFAVSKTTTARESFRQLIGM